MQRKNTDLRTLGNIFYYCCDELADIHFVSSMQLLLTLLKNILREKLFLTKEQINDFMDYFIASLSAAFKERLVLSSCEN
jgi:hypothetical protein